MTDKQGYRERIKFFILGALVVVGVLSLLGANSNSIDRDEVVLLDSDRYRIAAWGDAKAHGAFVMDSITGQTKIVYRLSEIGEDKLLERNHLNLRFTDIP